MLDILLELFGDVDFDSFEGLDSFYQDIGIDIDALGLDSESFSFNEVLLDFNTSTDFEDIINLQEYGFAEIDIEEGYSLFESSGTSFTGEADSFGYIEDNPADNLGIEFSGLENIGTGEGFSGQDLTQTVPKEHLEGITKISYAENTPSNFPGRTLGTYNPETKAIDLYNANPEKNIEVFRHEVGHHVWSENVGVQDDFARAAIQDNFWEESPYNLTSDAYPEEDHWTETFANNYAEYLKNRVLFSEKYPAMAEIFSHL